MEYLIGGLVGAALVAIIAIIVASLTATLLALMQEWLERATCGGRYTHILWRNGAGQIKQLELSNEMRWLLRANLKKTRCAIDQRRIKDTWDEVR